MRNHLEKFLCSTKSNLALHGITPIYENYLNLLAHHFQLLVSWNEVHNLASINTLEQYVIEHYIDCILALTKIENFANQEVVHDLGSGNGFPGIIGAINFPNSQFVLVESSRKKCSFLRLCVAELSLNNIIVLQQRVESLNEISFAISRAAFSPPLLEGIGGAFSKGARFALMTGPSFNAKELTLKSSSWGFVSESRYSLSTGAKRALITLCKK